MPQALETPGSKATAGPGRHRRTAGRHGTDPALLRGSNPAGLRSLVSLVSKARLRLREAGRVSPMRPPEKAVLGLAFYTAGGRPGRVNMWRRPLSRRLSRAAVPVTAEGVSESLVATVTVFVPCRRVQQGRAQAPSLPPYKAAASKTMLDPETQHKG